MHDGVTMLARYHGDPCLSIGVYAFIFLIGVIIEALKKNANTREDFRLRRRFGTFRQEESATTYRSQHGGRMLEAAKRTLQRVARRVNGQYSETGPQGTPRVTFAHRTGSGLLTIAQPGNDPRFERTQLTFITPGGFDERIEVLRQTVSDAKLRARGIVDVQIGDATFDPRFIVKGADDPRTREFFSPDVTAAIEAIRALGAGDNVILSINHQRLRIEKTPPLQSFEHFTALIDAARVMYDRADALNGPGGKVEFVEGASGETPVCQVCGSEVTSNRVDCAQCATPHHSDCWDFNKKCSTYGCGEKGCRPVS